MLFRSLALARAGQDGDHLLVQIAEARRVVDAFARRIEDGPFDMDADDAGHLGLEVLDDAERYAPGFAAGADVDGDQLAPGADRAGIVLLAVPPVRASRPTSVPPASNPGGVSRSVISPNVTVFAAMPVYASRAL